MFCLETIVAVNQRVAQGMTPNQAFAAVGVRMPTRDGVALSAEANHRHALTLTRSKELAIIHGLTPKELERLSAVEEACFPEEKEGYLQEEIKNIMGYREYFGKKK